MNIYLDIDGVLLTKTGEPAAHSLELIKYLTQHHTVYWLTTHCHGGENRAPEYLYTKFPAVAKPYIDKILPTDWGSWKTDAIDFSQDFRWLDDDVYKPERDKLAKQNGSNKLIEVNLQYNPEHLREIINTLSNLHDQSK